MGVNLTRKKESHRSFVPATKFVDSALGNFSNSPLSYSKESNFYFKSPALPLGTIWFALVITSCDHQENKRAT